MRQLANGTIAPSAREYDRLVGSTPMRIISTRLEAHYRGFRVEGSKKGECTTLHVIATRRGLPNLDCSRFLALPRCQWPKAVELVCDHIDHVFGNRPSPLRSVPPSESETNEQPAKVRVGTKVQII